MIRKWASLAALLLVALSALVAMTPARATVWVGSWDPQFGYPFTSADGWVQNYDLGWSGKVKVDDAGCVVPGGGGDIAGGCASVVSVTVSLYSVPNVLPAYNTLTFNPLSLTIGTLRYDNAGKLIAFSTTTESDYVYDSFNLNAPNGAGTDAYFAVQFVLDGGPCLFCDDAPFPDLGEYTGAVLFAGTYPEECEGFCDFYRSNVSEFPAIVTYTPEPASLTLLAAGLLAAGVATRRRRAAK